MPFIEERPVIRCGTGGLTSVPKAEWVDGSNPHPVDRILTEGVENRLVLRRNRAAEGQPAPACRKDGGDSVDWCFPTEGEAACKTYQAGLALEGHAAQRAVPRFREHEEARLRGGVQYRTRRDHRYPTSFSSPDAVNSYSK